MNIQLSGGGGKPKPLYPCLMKSGLTDNIYIVSKQKNGQLQATLLYDKLGSWDPGTQFSEEETRNMWGGLILIEPSSSITLSND